MELAPLRVRQSGYVTLHKIADPPDGDLSVMEAERDIPFAIRRVYYINNLGNCVSVRGKHAHRELQQVIFCINGSFVLSLDDGRVQQDVPMWRDHVGVLLGTMLWHTMHSFSSGCVLLVVASDYYRPADYIRDYDEFLRLARGGQP
jgi:hypothetical protein